MYGVIEGARLERRSDLIVALLPGVPIPQCNGAWVCEDSDAAVGALAEAVAEVEAAGEWPWVQTRSGHERTRQAALALGLTHTERLPGMVVRPDGFVDAHAELDIALIADDEIEEANRLLAASFEAPVELFEQFSDAVRQVEEARWYVGRAEGAIVSTALGFTLGGATGIFNVATPSEHRGADTVRRSPHTPCATASTPARSSATSSPARSDTASIGGSASATSRSTRSSLGHHRAKSPGRPATTGSSPGTAS